jgi:hypothetical protein
MSGAGPKSERSPAAPRTSPEPAPSRAGFVTMPTELRAFVRRSPNEGVLDTPDVAAAAESLRDAGRGGDVLFEKLHESAPREPSANDNRTEQVVIELPGGASPWARDAAGAKRSAAAVVDKEALPSATAPPRRPPPGVTVKSGAGAKTADSRPIRTWVAAAVTLCMVGVIVLVLVRAANERAPEGGTMGAPTATSSEPQATATAATAMAATTATAATSAAADAPIATGTASELPPAPATTGQPTALPSSTRPSSPGTVDPYPAPRVLPSVPATAEPSAAASVEPAPTVAPSTTTAAPAASGVKPWGLVIEKKEHEK